MKTIKELEDEGWLDQWDSGYGYRQALKDVLGLIVIAYKKCKDCFDRARLGNISDFKCVEQRLEHQINFSGRLDELTILYSNIKGCNFNEAKEELKKRITG